MPPLTAISEALAVPHRPHRAHSRLWLESVFMSRCDAASSHGANPPPQMHTHSFVSPQQSRQYKQSSRQKRALSAGGGGGSGRQQTHSLQEENAGEALIALPLAPQPPHTNTGSGQNHAPSQTPAPIAHCVSPTQDTQLLTPGSQAQANTRSQADKQQVTAERFSRSLERRGCAV